MNKRWRMQVKTLLNYANKISRSAQKNTSPSGAIQEAMRASAYCFMAGVIAGSRGRLSAGKERGD